MNSAKKDLWDINKHSPFVEEVLRYKTAGRVLDLGAGVGLNSFFLAKKGFDVTAVEIDYSCVGMLHDANVKNKKRITIIDANMLTFTPDIPFDVIICTMVLHFLQPKDVKAMFKKMKAWTTKGGLNAVAIYTDKNIPGKRPYLFKTQELKNFYDGWNILHYEEKPTEWFQFPGETMRRHNHAAYIIASNSKK